jgi:hypothetical protein
MKTLRILCVLIQEAALFSKLWLPKYKDVTRSTVLTEEGQPDETENGVKDEDKKNDSSLSFKATFPLLNGQ